MSSESDDDFLSADEDYEDKESDDNETKVVRGSTPEKGVMQIKNKEDNLNRNNCDEFPSTSQKTEDIDNLLPSTSPQNADKNSKNLKKNLSISSCKVEDISNKSTTDICSRVQENLKSTPEKCLSLETEFTAMSITPQVVDDQKTKQNRSLENKFTKEECVSSLKDALPVESEKFETDCVKPESQIREEKETASQIKEEKETASQIRKEKEIASQLREEKETAPQIREEKETVSQIREKRETASQIKEAKELTELPEARDQTAEPSVGTRQSLKKPREKLGQRLGAKKLGSRITKPLVGISSEEIKKKEEKLDDKKSDNDSLNTRQISDNLQTQEPKISEDSLQEVHKEDEEEVAWGTSWGNWGTSLITAASTFSKEMSRGVGTVLETVESTIGAPDPVLLAKTLVEEEKKAQTEESSQTVPEEASNLNPDKMEEINTSQPPSPSHGFDFGAIGTFGSLVSGVSGVFETASSKVLMGGLDTLEKIGRKTMDILQEGDPGLRRKRAFLKSNNPNLSMVLREARESAMREKEERSHSDTHSEGEGKYCRSMARIWDNTEGPVHLEALYLVARQCQEKTAAILQNLPSVWLEKLEERIAQIKTYSALSEDDREKDIPSTLMDVTTEVKLPLQFKNIITGWPSFQQSVNKISIEICGLGNSDLDSIQTAFYEDMANYVALVVGVCHKAAELALITPDLDGIKLAKQFQRLCSCISGGLEKSADEICEAISKSLPTSDPQINATITNIYVQVEELNASIESSLMHLNTIIIEAEAKLLHNEL